MIKFENEECITLCKKYKLHIEDANFAKGLIPKKILLDSTRNIHSYFVFCNLENGHLHSAYWKNKDFPTSLKSMLALQYSDLDRPLFFIFLDNKNEYNVIEGNEIREALLENPDMNLCEFIKENSVKLYDVITQIHNEL